MLKFLSYNQIFLAFLYLKVFLNTDLLLLSTYKKLKSTNLNFVLSSQILVLLEPESVSICALKVTFDTSDQYLITRPPASHQILIFQMQH